MADCIMAVGFEKMERGPIKEKHNNRTKPMDKYVETIANPRGFRPVLLLLSSLAMLRRSTWKNTIVQRIIWSRLCISRYETWYFAPSQPLQLSQAVTRFVST